MRFLVDNLEPKEQLIYSLASCCLLSRGEVKHVTSRLTTFEKNECLLVILSGKKKKLEFSDDCKDFVDFLDSGIFLHALF